MYTRVHTNRHTKRKSFNHMHTPTAKPRKAEHIPTSTLRRIPHHHLPWWPYWWQHGDFEQSNCASCCAWVPCCLVRVCMYVFIYLYMYACMWVFNYACIYLYMYACMWVFNYACIYVSQILVRAIACHVVGALYPTIYAHIRASLQVFQQSSA